MAKGGKRSARDTEAALLAEAVRKEYGDPLSPDYVPPQIGNTITVFISKTCTQAYRYEVCAGDAAPSWQFAYEEQNDAGFARSEDDADDDGGTMIGIEDPTQPPDIVRTSEQLRLISGGSRANGSLLMEGHDVDDEEDDDDSDDDDEPILAAPLRPRGERGGRGSSRGHRPKARQEDEPAAPPRRALLPLPGTAAAAAVAAGLPWPAPVATAADTAPFSPFAGTPASKKHAPKAREERVQERAQQKKQKKQKKKKQKPAPCPAETEPELEQEQSKSKRASKQKQTTKKSKLKSKRRARDTSDDDYVISSDTSEESDGSDSSDSSKDSDISKSSDSSDDLGGGVKTKHMRSIAAERKALLQEVRKTKANIDLTKVLDMVISKNPSAKYMLAKYIKNNNISGNRPAVKTKRKPSYRGSIVSKIYQSLMAKYKAKLRCEKLPQKMTRKLLGVASKRAKKQMKHVTAAKIYEEEDEDNDDIDIDEEDEDE